MVLTGTPSPELPGNNLSVQPHESFQRHFVAATAARGQSLVIKVVSLGCRLRDLENHRCVCSEQNEGKAHCLGKNKLAQEQQAVLSD